MSKIKNILSKRKTRIIVVVVLVVVLSAASGVGGYVYGVGGQKKEETVKEAENQTRSIVTIEETADGEILINGEGYKPNTLAVGEGRIFMEKVPTDCRETTAALKVIMGKGDIAAMLNPDQRFEFELLNILAKDVCSYEAYRNMLTSGLADFLYTSPTSIAGSETPDSETPNGAGAGQTGTGEEVSNEETDAALEPTITAPDNK